MRTVSHSCVHYMYIYIIVVHTNENDREGGRGGSRLIWQFLICLNVHRFDKNDSMLFMF